MTDYPTRPIADLHCDTVIPMRRGYDIFRRNNDHHIDIPRLQEGGVNIQVFASSCNLIEQGESSRDRVIRQVELLHLEFGKHPELIEICLTSSDIERVTADGKIAAILSIEGGLALGMDVSKIKYFYDKGVRIITIAHEAPNGWCANHKEADPGFYGLSDLGRDMISEMNRLGIIIDLSHSSDATVEEVMKISSAPVIASHSNSRALCNHARNLTNQQIKAIARTGGMIGVTFVNNFISETYDKAYEAFWSGVSSDHLKQLSKLYSAKITDSEFQERLEKDFADIIEGEKSFQHLRSSIGDVIDQIDYIANLVGPEFVGIGSDFNGTSSTPMGLEDCSKVADILNELTRRSYNKADIDKILGGNFLRVFSIVCGH